jgi:hypothetical protein
MRDDPMDRPFMPASVTALRFQMRGDIYHPVTFVREATRPGVLIVAKQDAPCDHLGLTMA